MRTASIICSSNTLPPYPCSVKEYRASTLLPVKHVVSGAIFSFFSKLRPSSSRIRSISRFITHTTDIQEIVETSSSDVPFIQIGYIYGVHGLQGEVRVKPNTDFPELRFSKPGTRWLKQQVSGTDITQEIELVEGRGNPQSWIVRFNNINTVEQARKLVGSSIMVRDEDRPVLEEGEFYTNDLIGMTVILKESGETVGTVVKVFNSGANDLLQVKLNSLRKIPDLIGNSEDGAADSGPLVWIPFVEAIVPSVDLEEREMIITPPKGLLELNIRTNERSKKERRELEWKERKKFQRHLVAAKKKLHEMNQDHVFHGFRYGEKNQGVLLANQIVTMNLKLLQQALQNLQIPSTRSKLLQCLSAVPRSNTFKVCDNSSSPGNGIPSESYLKLQRKGCALTSNGKVAIVLVLGEIEEATKALLDDHLRFIKITDRSTVPMVFVCPTGSVISLQQLFSDHDYFQFNPQKVWFLEEEKLPVISSSIEEHSKHKILMKSPWECLQKPVGSGGVISLFSSQDSLVDELSELGVEYIKVCRINQEHKYSLALVGLVDSCQANVGVHFFDETTLEADLDVILAMSFLRKLVKQVYSFQFEGVIGCNSYVEKVEKEWVDVVPTASNSYEFRSSIYCCLNATPANKICVLYPAD